MKIKLVTPLGEYVETVIHKHTIDGIIIHNNKRYRYDTWLGCDTIQYRETNDYWERRITNK